MATPDTAEVRAHGANILNIKNQEKTMPMNQVAKEVKRGVFERLFSRTPFQKTKTIYVEEYVRPVRVQAPLTAYLRKPPSWDAPYQPNDLNRGGNAVEAVYRPDTSMDSTNALLTMLAVNSLMQSSQNECQPSSVYESPAPSPEPSYSQSPSYTSDSYSSSSSSDSYSSSDSSSSSSSDSYSSSSSYD